MSDITIGMTAELSEIVTERVTAAAYGSGFVAAYATPAMIALMEGASAAAIQPSLSAGQTSVGTAVNITHLAATPIGMRVRVRAQVIAVDGRRVTLQVEAFDDQEKIGAGTHTRAVVDVARFADKLVKKNSQTAESRTP